MSAGPILVTGASGFLGARVTEALVDEGRAVRAWIHRRPVAVATERLVGDLRDEATRQKAVEGASSVVHGAALLDPIASEDDADAVNHRATVALAEAAARAGCACFVFVSSQAAIGWRADAGLVDEHAPLAPTTIYGRSKRDAEQGVARAELGAMRVVILRPPTIYGPGERRNFLALTRAVATGLFPIPGDGGNRMSFCHLDNAVEAARFALDVEAARGPLHVADARPVTLRDAVTTIARAAGRHPLPVPFPLGIARLAARATELAFAPLRRPPPLSRARLATLTADCALDTRRLARLGFVPPVGFEEGVRETVARYLVDGALAGATR